MSNILLLSPRISDLSTVASGGAASTSLAVTNIQTMQPSKKYRTVGTAGEFVTFSLTAAATIKWAAMVGANFSTNATWRWRGATTLGNTTAAPTYDSGTVSMWPGTGKPTDAGWPVFTNLANLTANVTSLQYWRVDFTDSTPVTTYFEMGRLLVDTGWQPASANFDLAGTPLGYDTTGDVQSRTRYGRTFTSQSAESPPRIFQLSYFALSEAEAIDGLGEIQRLRGKWGDVICSLDPATTTRLHKWTLQGVFTDTPMFSLPPAFDANGNMWGASKKLIELL